MVKYVMMVLMAAIFSQPAGATPKVVIKPPSKQECTLLADSLKQQLENGNYCRDDSECAGVALGCPAGCVSLLNVNEDVARLVALKQNYDTLCGECTYRCPAEPKGRLVCVDRKCVYQ
jgi:hypothetical protein